MDDLLENPPKLPLILFDDQCPLCVRFTQSLKLAGREKAPDFLSIHHPALTSIFPTIDVNALQESIHYLDARSVVYTGTEAVSEIIKLVPAAEKFAWLIDSAMGQKAMDFFYNTANRMRDSLLNRCGACKKS